VYKKIPEQDLRLLFEGLTSRIKNKSKVDKIFYENMKNKISTELNEEEKMYHIETRKRSVIKNQT
jgi:hypothetical protein